MCIGLSYLSILPVERAVEGDRHPLRPLGQKRLRPSRQATVQRPWLDELQQAQQPVVARHLFYAEALGQQHPDALAVCPLADLADIFQAAQGAQYHDSQRLADAVEVALVFPACFNLRKVLGYIAGSIHDITLYHDTGCEN